MAVTDIDEAKLEAFFGLVRDRDRRGAERRRWSRSATSWASTARWPTASPSRPPSCRAHRHAASATCASGSTRRPLAASSSTPTAATSCPLEHALVLADETSPVPDRRAASSRRTPSSAAARRVAERFVDGRRRRLARARPRPLARHRARVRGRLPHAPGRGLAAGARRRRRATRGRAPSGRRRLRAWRLDDPAGAGLPGFAVRRDRLPRRVDRDRPPPRRAGGRRGPGHVRGGRRRRATWARASTSSRSSTPSTTSATRSPRPAARAALAPDGTVLLVEPFAGDTVQENLNPIGRMYYGFSTLVLHAGVAVAAGPGRAGHAGRPGGDRRGAGRGRVRVGAARGRDAAQSGAGSASMSSSWSATNPRRKRLAASR